MKVRNPSTEISDTRVIKTTALLSIHTAMAKLVYVKHIEDVYVSVQESIIYNLK